jgi:hypothetical protein
VTRCFERASLSSDLDTNRSWPWEDFGRIVFEARRLRGRTKWVFQELMKGLGTVVYNWNPNYSGVRSRRIKVQG